MFLIETVSCVATQAAMGLAALHNFDVEGRASVAHTDIAPNQWIKVNGIYKLNDFNRARFLRYSQTNHTVCPFEVGRNAGKNRSPEEYSYGPETHMVSSVGCVGRQPESLRLTALWTDFCGTDNNNKVDIYSFGNILYMLLQEDWPFSDVSSDDTARLVKKGARPKLSQRILNSTDPLDQLLLEAMTMCLAYKPEDRASAREVEALLKSGMKRLDPGRLEEWGDA